MVGIRRFIASMGNMIGSFSGEQMAGSGLMLSKAPIEINGSFLENDWSFFQVSGQFNFDESGIVLWFVGSRYLDNL